MLNVSTTRHPRRYAMQPGYVLLYVDNPSASAAFYSDLLGLQPLQASPTFALFLLDSGMKLGLWGRQGVEPATYSRPASSELCFALADNDKVETCYRLWEEKGLAIAQQPTAMDFGYTFVALDPDGHRLRVLALSGV
jgi:catechol 2,3-dioxygenase-like lactoylglutathione lyase family enzyme